MTDTTTAERVDDSDVERRIRVLQRVSIVEAMSYLVLLVAAVVKRTGGSELGVEVLGPVHGILFLVYVLLIVRDRGVLGWSAVKALGAMILGSLPFGAIWVERRWLQQVRSTSGATPGADSVLAERSP